MSAHQADYRAGQLARLAELGITLPATFRHAISTYQFAMELQAPTQRCPEPSNEPPQTPRSTWYAAPGTANIQAPCLLLT